MELKKQNLKTESGLIILNYDAFSGIPDELHNSANKPPLSELLDRIISKGNLLIIVSGDRKETIDQMFGHLNCILIVENGAVFKKNGTWETNFSGNTFWKKNLEPLFEAVTQKCPKSFTEEKEYSLIWNYKAAEPITGILHAGQLKKTLDNIIHFYNLKIVDHYSTIEVMGIEISRMKTIKQLLEEKEFSNICVLDETITDEDIAELTLRIKNHHHSTYDLPPVQKVSGKDDSIEILRQLGL